MANILHVRCVLITGATSGIGRALALAIHELQTKPTVIVVGRRQERLNELARLSDRIKPVRFDVSGGREALKQFAADMISQFPEVRSPCDASFAHKERTHIDACEPSWTRSYSLPGSST